MVLICRYTVMLRRTILKYTVHCTSSNQPWVKMHTCNGYAYTVQQDKENNTLCPTSRCVNKTEAIDKTGSSKMRPYKAW